MGGKRPCGLGGGEQAQTLVTYRKGRGPGLTEGVSHKVVGDDDWCVTVFMEAWLHSMKKDVDCLSEIVDFGGIQPHV